MSKLTHILFKLVLIILPVLFVQDVLAQRIQPNRWFFKVDGGISVFFGDVKRYDYIPDFESPSEVQLMYSASFGKELTKIFSIRGQFLYGELSGHKKSAHYNFHSTLMGGSLLTDINLFYLFTGARFGDTKLNIYSSIGAGYLLWDTELLYDNPPADGSNIMDLSKTGAFSIPSSLSLEYAFNRNFSISGEGVLYIVTSDEVDAKVGGIKIDMLSYMNVGFAYKFGIKTKARGSRVKYGLSADIYEAKPGDPQYREKEAVVVITPDVEPVVEEVVEPVVEEAVELVVEDDVEEAVVVIAETDSFIETETNAVVKNSKDIVSDEVLNKQKNDSEVFPINHELEKAGIQKEVWASKSEDPWPEIEFSVQVLASKSSISVKKISDELGVSEVIVKKYDGEWYRYSVGQYDKLWKAKELRNKLRSAVGVKDAFIVVYRNEERISLSEALNYTKGKQLKSSDDHFVKGKSYGNRMVTLVYNIPETGIAFGVQVLSIRNNEYPLGNFAKIDGTEKPILINFKDPWYKIIISGFDSYQEASDFQFRARDKGFIDAFIVAFVDGRRVSIRRLKEELGN